MPSNKSLMMIALIALLAWLASTSFFVVNEQQSGIQRRFERTIDDDLAPGLHMKLPVVDKVVLFDNRVQTLLMDGRQFVLASGEGIVGDIVATWKIDSPERYDNAAKGDVSKVTNELMQATVAQLGDQLGRVSLADLSTSRQEQVLQAACTALDERMHDALGVTVTGIAFRRITLPDTRTVAVEQKMTAAWQHDATVAAADGQDAADQVRADAERRKAMILATAHENAEAAKSATDAEIAARYNDAFARNPAFFRFYHGLKTWRDGMQHGNGVLVLGPEDDLVRWIKAGH